jgi:hypothetical protein
VKTIKDLCDSPYDISITGITDDSREVKEGYLFVATKGFNVDHFDYIDDAINNTFEVLKDEVYIANPWVYKMTASWAAYNYLWDNGEDTETSYGFAWTVTMLCRDLIIEDKFFDITEIYTDWERL